MKKLLLLIIMSLSFVSLSRGSEEGSGDTLKAKGCTIYNPDGTIKQQGNTCDKGQLKCISNACTT